MTGGGAYLISGGLSGAWLYVHIILLTLFIIIASIGLSIALAGLIWFVVTYAEVIAFVAAIMWLGQTLTNTFGEFITCVQEVLAVHVIFDTLEEIGIYYFVGLTKLIHLISLGLLTWHATHLNHCLNDLIGLHE